MWTDMGSTALAQIEVLGFKGTDLRCEITLQSPAFRTQLPSPTEGRFQIMRL